MKHDALKSIAHNIGDSLSSGIGMLIGYYAMDIYGEAASSTAGHITIDCLTGEISGGPVSASLRNAIHKYCQALPAFCERNGATVSDFSVLLLRFWSTALGCRFLVTVEDIRGRRSETEYGGIPGRRVKVLDAMGRLRPKIRRV